MRTLEGTGRVTPIKMSDLNNRIDNLKNRGRFGIRTLSNLGSATAPSYKIPTEFIGWNFLIIETSCSNTVGSEKFRINAQFNGTSISSSCDKTNYKNECSVSYSISGDRIVGNASSYAGGEIKVLFYTGAGE